MHKTQSEFENHLTFKIFIFQFVNFYASIFYIAFAKGNFIGYPGNYNKIFGYQQEEVYFIRVKIFNHLTKSNDPAFDFSVSEVVSLS